jgi:uncharacterized membrane protein (GlpM family)
MPGARFSISTTRSRRCLKLALCFGMKSLGPLSASTDAAWLIEHAFDVDCDWMVVIALISSVGPPAKPIRQPVMQ